MIRCLARRLVRSMHADLDLALLNDGFDVFGHRPAQPKSYLKSLWWLVTLDNLSRHPARHLFHHRQNVCFVFWYISGKLITKKKKKKLTFPLSPLLHVLCKKQNQKKIQETSSSGIVHSLHGIVFRSYILIRIYINYFPIKKETKKKNTLYSIHSWVQTKLLLCTQASKRGVSWPPRSDVRWRR